ncbi:MAG: integral membrane sensor protein, partial [Meiothermus sp.]
PTLTLLSVVFAMVGAAISFNLASKPQVSPLQVLLSGTALGAGIGMMHYVGMFAMRMNAKLEFSLPMVGVSVLVAVVIGTLGIWLLTTSLTRNLPGRNLIAAAVTGSAIP